MKKLKYILFVVMLIPLNCFAIELYCDKTVKSESEFNCILSNNSNSLFELNFNLNYSPQLKISNIKYSKGYEGTVSGDAYTIKGPGLNAQTTIAIFTLKAPLASASTSMNVKVSDIKYKFLDSENNYHTGNDLTSSIEVIKSDKVSTTTSTTTTTTTTVSNPNEEKTFKVNLKKDNGEEDEVLSCKTTNVTCNINLKEAEEPHKEGFTFKGWNTTANCESGYKDLYKIASDTILYACYEKNGDVSGNFLRSINIENYILSDFSMYKYIYTLKVENDVTSLNVNAVPLNDNAKVYISENVNNLNIGDNEIRIDVVLNDLTTTYIINVYRNQLLNDSAEPILDDILINNIRLDSFSPNTFFYNYTVKYGTTNVFVTPVVSNEGIKYTITGMDNITDNSIIRIHVENNMNVENVYSIKINYESFVVTYLYYVYFGGVLIFCIVVYFAVRYKLKHPKDKNKDTKNNKSKKGKKNKQIETKEENIEKL